LTLLAEPELNGKEIIDVFSAANARYAKRLGIDVDAAERAHRAMAARFW
jgi:hypothetical protein